MLYVKQFKTIDFNKVLGFRVGGGGGSRREGGGVGCDTRAKRAIGGSGQGVGKANHKIAHSKQIYVLNVKLYQWPVAMLNDIK